MEYYSKKSQNQHHSLWVAFLEGDDKAFKSLFDLFSDLLYRYGTKFIANDDVLKDCIQDVFIKIYDHRSSLSVTDNPRLYLFKALKNKLIDKIRADKHLIYLSPEELQFTAEYLYQPEYEVDLDAEIKEKFETVMLLLTDRQREALYLRYQMEMPYQDISQLLNINYQSTRNLIHRAIEKVRAEMDWRLFVFLLLKHIY